MNWHFCIDSPEKHTLDLCGGSMDIGPGLGAGCYTSYGWRNGDGEGCGYDLGFGNGPREADTYPISGVTQAQATNWWKSAKHWI